MQKEFYSITPHPLGKYSVIRRTGVEEEEEEEHFCSISERFLGRKCIFSAPLHSDGVWMQFLLSHHISLFLLLSLFLYLSLPLFHSVSLCLLCVCCHALPKVRDFDLLTQWWSVREEWKEQDKERFEKILRLRGNYSNKEWQKCFVLRTSVLSLHDKCILNLNFEPHTLPLTSSHSLSSPWWLFTSFTLLPSFSPSSLSSFSPRTVRCSNRRICLWANDHGFSVPLVWSEVANLMHGFQITDIINITQRPGYI